VGSAAVVAAEKPEKLEAAMSATLIWIMCAAIVASLAVWLGVVTMAARNPAFKQPRIEPRIDPRFAPRRHGSPMDR
jgi:hypothetical protein